MNILGRLIFVCLYLQILLQKIVAKYLLMQMLYVTSFNKACYAKNSRSYEAAVDLLKS